jgi:hypothetical protein
MSLTGFHPLWDKILSQNLQAVADQGCHLEGSSPYQGTAYRGEDCTWHNSAERIFRPGKTLNTTLSTAPSQGRFEEECS